MNRIAILALASTALAAFLPAQRGERDRQRPQIELKHFTFAEKAFDSPSIGGEAQYGIYLPKGYDDEANAGKKWPLAIWLHGMRENHLRFHTRGGARVLDEAAGDGSLPPCVFVSANAGGNTLYLNRKDKKYEDLISVDLLAHLTKTYRVSEKRTERAILGVSMGGMGALRIALTHPHLFGAVGAHSAAVFPADPATLPERTKAMVERLGLKEMFGDPIQKEPWAKANPLNLALAADPKDLEGMRIYFDAGSDDRYGFQAGNELLHEAMEKKKIAHTYRLIEGGGHSWGDPGFSEAAVAHSLATVGGMFKAAADGNAKGKGDAAPASGNGDGKEEMRAPGEERSRDHVHR